MVCSRLSNPAPSSGESLHRWANSTNNVQLKERPHLASSGNRPMSRDERDVKGFAFRTSSRIESGRLVVQLDGCLDMETVVDLRGFLERITDDLEAQIVNSFEFDTCQLYLMNSTAISCFASWVKRIKEMYPESRVKFRTNPNLPWQKRTLSSIRRVAERIVFVE